MRDKLEEHGIDTVLAYLAKTKAMERARLKNNGPDPDALAAFRILGGMRAIRV